MYSPSGIISSIITPFKKNYELDLDGLKELIRYQLDSKVDGILVAGFNGEFTSLSMKELKELFKVTIEEVDGRTKMITQTGLPNTRETVDLTSYSKEIGADAALIMPPYYILPSEDGIYKHYEAITREVDMPIIIFNYPASGHPNLRPEFVDRLTNIKNIVGIKESTPDIVHMQDIIKLVGDKISVMSGLGSNTLPALAAGAKGVVAGYTTVAPKMAKELYDAFKGGDYLKAREINLKLYPLMRSAANASGIKAALKIMGLPAGPVRPPLLPVGNEEEEKIRNILEKLDLLR